MMWSFFDPASGRFADLVFTGSEHQMRANVPDGMVPIEGRFDPMSQRVQDGAVVDFVPEKPEDTEHVVHAWNETTKRWEAALTKAGMWSGMRAQRDRLLAASDWIVTRSTERGEPVPTPWLTYRQALRDITEQPDPENIVWPQRP